MFFELYTLDIISQHDQFKGKTLRKHSLDGVETVGAYGDEAFAIHFKNNSGERVQVKISLDGTDILTGKEADTQITKDMWVVEAYSALNLTAWPETTKAGAQFIFTSADKSVAVHTHGNLSSRGIIAAAVYTEGYKWNYTPTYIPFVNIPTTPYYPYWYHTTNQNTFQIIPNTITYPTYLTYTSNMISNNIGNSTSYLSCNNTANSLESLPGVGAGNVIGQQIGQTTGLYQPKFETTLRLKYMWWNELREALNSRGEQPAIPNGFPGDRIMSLGNTPRQEKQCAMPVNIKSELLRF